MWRKRSHYSTHTEQTRLKFRDNISRLYQTSLYETSTILHCYGSVQMQNRSKSLQLYVSPRYRDTQIHAHTERPIFYILKFQKSGVCYKIYGA
jgi:hypothetical protein